MLATVVIVSMVIAMVALKVWAQKVAAEIDPIYRKSSDPIKSPAIRAQVVSYLNDQRPGTGFQ